MSEKHELPSDSDEDDEDYIPEGYDSVSEVESDGDAENSRDNNTEDIQNANNSKRRKRCKNTKSKDSKGKKKQRNSLSEKKEVDESAEKDSKAKLLSEEEEKKRADSLWADFMKDTDLVSKPKSENSAANSSSEKPCSLVTRPKVAEKVKITKIFEFAGEEVKVEKEVPADSAEARLSVIKRENLTKNINVSTPNKNGTPTDQGTRKVGLGGISAIIGQLGKKSKISTLEKTKLDWDNFKKEEDIEEEISTHNKGKDGYLDKQDFLQRADVRQFEIEKQLRTTSRRSNR